MNKKRKCISRMPSGLAGFIAKARLAQDKLSAPQFNTVLPAPATVIANLDQLQVFLAESLAHNYANLEARELLRRQTQAMISQQVSYVNSIADGNEAILEQSGFDLSKEPTPTPMPTQGKVQNVEDLNAGSALVIAKNDPFTEVFELEVTGPNGYSKKHISLYHKIKVSDLPVSVKLSIKVRGLNNKGEGIWSAPYGYVAKMDADLENNSNN